MCFQICLNGWGFFFFFFPCIIQRAPLLHFVTFEEEMKTYQKKAFLKPLTSEEWQITKKRKKTVSAGMAIIILMYADFDFTFIGQGQSTTCWRVGFYVHVYGFPGLQRLCLSDSFPAPQGDTCPTHCHTSALIHHRDRGCGDASAHLHILCAYMSCLQTADRWKELKSAHVEWRRRHRHGGFLTFYHFEEEQKVQRNGTKFYICFLGGIMHRRQSWNVAFHYV